jgi:hypothetical protein|tara:strand:- start:1526 stop:1750 length:225 start_codon:yes stop_codon:yes gene_type:complete
MKNFILFSYYLLFIVKPSPMYSHSKKPKIKNLKINIETHTILKEYCKKNGLKMFAFVEKLIEEKCKPKKGIYME